MQKNIIQVIHGKHYGGGEEIVYLLNHHIDKQRFNIGTVCLADGFLRDKLDDTHKKVYSLIIKSKSNPLNLLRLFLLVTFYHYC